MDSTSNIEKDDVTLMVNNSGWEVEKRLVFMTTWSYTILFHYTEHG